MALHVDLKGRTVLAVNYFFQVQFSGGFAHHQAALPTSELYVRLSFKKMKILIPDLEWYLAISNKNNSSPRCPFATIESCPRFYQSLSLLGSAGSTSIEKSEDEPLLE